MVFKKTALCLCLIASLSSVSVFAGTYEGMEYEIKDGQVSITDFPTYTEVELSIPEEIEGKPVTTIAENAFYYCRGIVGISIPKSVTFIGKYALKNCYGLTNISVDEENPNYCSIDGNLYNKAGTELIQYSIYKKENKFVIPEGVTKICDSALNYAYPLKEVVIPDSVKTIEYNAFYYCEGLTDVNIGNGVETIGNCAFNLCTGLKNVVIPDNCKIIDTNAFRGCDKLKTITIGKGVTKIGDWAFKVCDSITDVYYTGTQEEWKKIAIGKDNENLTNATIHYNSKIAAAPKSETTASANKIIPKREYKSVLIDFFKSLRNRK